MVHMPQILFSYFIIFYINQEENKLESFANIKMSQGVTPAFEHLREF